MFNRKMYKDIKKYDRDKMEKFWESVYSQGFNDGVAAGDNADFRIKLSEVLIKAPGIGPKRYDDIMQMAKEMGI